MYSLMNDSAGWGFPIVRQEPYSVIDGQGRFQFSRNDILRFATIGGPFVTGPADCILTVSVMPNTSRTGKRSMPIATIVRTRFLPAILVIVVCVDSNRSGAAERSIGGLVQTATTHQRKVAEHELLEKWTRIGERINTLDLSGSESRTLIPVLSEIMGDALAPEILRRRCAATLARIGPTAAPFAMPVLLRLLEEDDSNVKRDDVAERKRLWILKSLGMFRSGAADTVPLLRVQLSDQARSIEDRTVVADTLGQIGTAAALRVVARELLSARGNSERDVSLLREVLVDAVTYSGAQGIVTISALVRATTDRKAAVRRKACLAIGGLGPQAESAIDVLVERFALDDDAAVRDTAAEAMSRLGPVAVPILRQAVSSDDPELQWRAAKALSTMGRAAHPAVRELTDAWESPDARVRLRSKAAVWQITGQTLSAGRALIREFVNPDRQIRRQAATLLTEPRTLPQALVDDLTVAAAGTGETSRIAAYVLRQRRIQYGDDEE